MLSHFALFCFLLPTRPPNLLMNGAVGGLQTSALSPCVYILSPVPTFSTIYK